MANPAENSLVSIGSMLFVTLSLFLFVFKNIFISGWTAEEANITPFRWISATVVPIVVMSWGHGSKNLSTSGALLALVLGFSLTLAHYSFFLCLLAFFISSSKAAKYKQQFVNAEENTQEGAERNGVEVICNGGMALKLSLLYLLDIGSSDLPVDFRNQYRASWLGMALLGSLSCCNGDAWARELGTVLGGDPFLITTFQRVPKGTNGGVTLIGLLSSVVGGIVIGFAYYLGVLMSATSVDMEVAPNQVLIIVAGGLGGLLGSVLDSLLGASLQFSGKDVLSGKIVEVAREDVVPISGKMVLDNHSVNLVSSILTALLLPKFALSVGL